MKKAFSGNIGVNEKAFSQRALFVPAQLPVDMRGANLGEEWNIKFFFALIIKCDMRQRCLIYRA